MTRRHQNDPDLRRRSGDARHADRDPQAGLPRADGVERRGGAGAAQERGRRSDPAGHPPARHQRLRRAAHRQGELQPDRVHHDLGDQRGRDRGAGDEARRLPLHHQGLRLRRAALAGAQRLRAAGSEPAGDHAQRAGRRAERARVHHRAVAPDPRHRRSGAARGQAVGDGADSRRERHRQGAAGAAAAQGVGPRRRAVHRRQHVGDPARAGREHALRPRARRVHRRASSSSSASSSWPPAARCSSTRSATCASICRPSCCARSRKGRSSGSAAPSRSRPTSA